MGRSFGSTGTITAGSSVSHRLSIRPHWRDRISRVEIEHSPPIEVVIAPEWAAEQNEKLEHNIVGWAA
jgi:hypothetical protein